jgi:DNA-binding XRE family transcriptional regulator
MAKNFKTLRARMSPQSRARSSALAKKMMAEMGLGDVRKTQGLTQTELAKLLGVKQASLSKLEGQKDMQISTLRKFVEGLGGELEIFAAFPKARVQLRQDPRSFNSRSRSHARV